METKEFEVTELALHSAAIESVTVEDGEMVETWDRAHVRGSFFGSVVDLSEVAAFYAKATGALWSDDEENPYRGPFSVVLHLAGGLTITANVEG